MILIYRKTCEPCENELAFDPETYVIFVLLRTGWLFPYPAVVCLNNQLLLLEIGEAIH